MAIVTCFGAIERLLGFIYRIFLSRNLGAEGVGLYQIALSVVGLIVTITASGIPITVSRIMTKHNAEMRSNKNNSVISAGILLSLIISLPLCFILFFFGKYFTFIFTDERCYIILKIILPGIVLTSIYAVIRGAFWGEKKFFTYSIIELLEEFVMLIVGIILINGCKNAFLGAKKAGFAVLISYVFSFITATTIFFINGGRIKKPKGELKPLVVSATPITLMRTVNATLNTIIAIILPLRLVHFGLTNKEALSVFGEMSGMSIPLIYIPSTIIGSIALVLVPELSSNFYRRDNLTLKNNVEKAVKCSIFIAVLIVPVFISMGKEIGILVYNNENAGRYVSKSAIIMLPLSISLITTSMLNSLNLERKTLLYYLGGAICLVVCIYFLPKFIGVYSLIVGLIISYFTTAIFNLLLIKKTCKIPPKYKGFIIASFIFVIPSSMLGYFLKNILLNYTFTWCAVIISSIVVVAFTYLFYLIFDLFNVKDLLSN